MLDRPQRAVRRSVAQCRSVIGRHRRGARPVAPALDRDMTPRLAFLAGLRGTHDEDVDPEPSVTGRAATPRATSGLQWHWQEEFSLRAPTTTPGRNSMTRASIAATSSGAMHYRSLSTLATSTRKERLTMDSQASRIFWLRTRDRAPQGAAVWRRHSHRGARSPAVARLAGYIHLVGAGGDRRDVERAGIWRMNIERRKLRRPVRAEPQGHRADRQQSRKLNKEQDLYPDLEDDDAAMLKRLRRISA